MAMPDPLRARHGHAVLNPSSPIMTENREGATLTRVRQRVNEVLPMTTKEEEENSKAPQRAASRVRISRLLPASIVRTSVRIKVGLFLLSVVIVRETMLLHPWIPIKELRNVGVPPAPCRHIDGGLWSDTDLELGVGFVGESDADIKRTKRLFRRISLVISHCIRPLDWLDEFTRGFDGVIGRTTVISKCGKPVLGVPDEIRRRGHMEVITDVKNVGRCDHSYAYYITTLLSKNGDSRSGGEVDNDVDGDDELIIFLKDDRTFTPMTQLRTLSQMVRIASRKQIEGGGVACGRMESYWNYRSLYLRKCRMSMYHDTASLVQFSMETYSNKQYGEVRAEVAPFSSPYKNLGEWAQSVGLFTFPEPLTQVCYGGTFAATRSAIARQPMEVWKNFEHSLSRGDNIEEGHFMERSWAALLSVPLHKLEVGGSSFVNASDWRAREK